MKQEPKVWSCNAVGIFLAIYYGITFARLVPKSKQASLLEATTPTLPGTVAQHLHGFLAVVFATTLLAFTKPFAANTANLIGNLGVLFCIGMFASPLSVIKVVLQTRSAKSIPLPFTVVSCVNCFLWVVFGLFEKHDVNIYLPNCLGLSFGIVQVILKLLFVDQDAALPSYQGVAPNP
jgi:solute carrier family 50 (sugar transporter)